jgi:hypothetical protein
MTVDLIFNNACKMAVIFFSIALPYKLGLVEWKMIISIKLPGNQMYTGCRAEAA